MVVSKGRPNGTTLVELENYNMSYVVVLEREDLSDYQQALKHATFWVLPESGRGIGYSRHYILSKATQPYLMLDDDLTAFYQKKESMQPLSMQAFVSHACHMFTTYVSKYPDIAFFGFKQGTFALPKVEATWQTTIAHAVIVNAPVVRASHIAYDANLRVFEDIDVLFQAAQKGLRICRYNRLIYFTPASGTKHVGGISYDSRLKQQYLEKMVARWPEWIRDENIIRDGDKQPKYHIRWDVIRNALCT